MTMQEKNKNRNGELGSIPAENNRPEQLYTPSEIGKSLCLCSATIKNWIRSGKIKAMRFGPNTLRVPESELLRFQQQAVAA
jgi:excisionase family DNA binding protein